MQFTLLEKKAETGDVVTFRFAPEEALIWEAGQFLTYHLDHPNPDEKGVEHFFTIASAPYEGVAQITTRLTGSTFKNALNALPIGGKIEAKNLEGDFTLHDLSEEYVFIAGGIGITPFHSILKQLDHEGKQIKATLLYGNRSSDQIVFKEELESWSSKNPNFKIHYLISPEKINAESIRRLVPDLSQPKFYISGPEPMVESLEKMCMDELHIPEERLIRDYFPGYDEHNF